MRLTRRLKLCRPYQSFRFYKYDGRVQPIRAGKCLPGFAKKTGPKVGIAYSSSTFFDLGFQYRYSRVTFHVIPSLTH